MRRVAVVGAGTMGHSIALAFAMTGTAVALVDVSDASLRTAKRRLAADLEVIADAPTSAATLARLSFTTSLPEATASADLVIESVPEDLPLKRAVWTALGEAAASDAILASNTSSFDISVLAALVPNPQRVLGLHWFNPAHLVPCVEIVTTPDTDASLVTDMQQLLTEMGKKPAVVRSTPGFVANRIQMAMLAEAFRCLEEGVATAEAIDDIVRYALGFRLVDLGPFVVGDLGGYDVYSAIYAYLREHLGDRFATPRTVAELAAAGQLGVKSGQGVYAYSAEEAAQLVQRRDRAFATRSQSPVLVTA